MSERGGEGKRGVVVVMVVVFARSASPPLFPRISSSGEALGGYSCCGVALVFAGPLGARSLSPGCRRRHFEL